MSCPCAQVIILGDREERQQGWQAVGAGDFHYKSVRIDDLKAILQRGFYMNLLERELEAMQQWQNAEEFEGMLGTSPAMQEVYDAIRKVAMTDAQVLILGESGTGKEMVAQAIHQRSRCKTGPFVTINCGAIPETLLESEMFGYEKGAFTGAHTLRKGRIESAAGGTLFLDEIGELPISLQVKLLRFLQDQAVERIGGRACLHINARIIAATNTNLKKAMETGKFREDLFYRIAVVEITLPPLCERGNDILLLAQAALQTYARQYHKDIPQFTQDALGALRTYHWPGNVRELKNRVKRAVIMVGRCRICASDLGLSNRSEPMLGKSLKAARAAVELEMVQKALRKHHGKMNHAAADLGISRSTLYELMEKLGIARSHY